MRVAVISDIHGNAQALDAVLAAVDRERPDAVWCLGDLVGYGPRPNRCTRLVAAHADICLAGNHDLGVLGTIEIDEFSPDAAASARWTRSVLEAEAREYLASLAPQRRTTRAELYHASPRDPVWEYVMSADAAEAALLGTELPVVLIGHSHVALAIREKDGEIAGGLAPDGTDVDLGAGRWLLNPGSVGQPRDGDPRAAWLLLDFRAGRASFHRVEYDVAATKAEIRERGLPEHLATRLDLGA
jgi:predicted phosphodiesterase